MTQEKRVAPLEMSPEEFRRHGHRLVDDVAEFLASLPSRPVTRGEKPSQIRATLPDDRLPETGEDAGPLLENAARLLAEHSLFNGHPRFFGYITSSAAPIGALADLLAAAVNPNTGGYQLSPVATEIEKQAVRWVADLIGFPRSGSGLLVSGGNMANFVAFLAARRAKFGAAVREKGLGVAPGARIYSSAETHTWLQKAADLFGFGTGAVCQVPVDARLRMDTTALARAIAQDKRAGLFPFLVVGTAGTVSTGAVDPLPEIGRIAREHGLWFHVDGAYGAPAAMLPDAPEDLRALAGADSVAVDPHKWLYTPLEAGCTLTADPNALSEAFSYHPTYYHFDSEEEQTNFYELGLQNSRGFRALKVWLAIRRVGRGGFARMISDDIALARRLAQNIARHGDFEGGPGGLSIVTFRYAPRELRSGPEAEERLNRLNTELLTRLQDGGEAFVSNAVVGGKFLLRACIVNFRTGHADVDALPEIVARVGREVARDIV